MADGSVNPAPVGPRWRQRRLGLGMTQAAVQRAIGLPPSQLSQWESGARHLDPEDFARIQWCYGVPGPAPWVPRQLAVLGRRIDDLATFLGRDEAFVTSLISGVRPRAEGEQVAVAALLGLTDRDWAAMLNADGVPVILETLYPNALRLISNAVRDRKSSAPYGQPLRNRREPEVAPVALAGTTRPVALGERFRMLRIELQLSRVALSRATAIPSSRIADFERRRASLVAEELARLQWCVGIPVGGDWMEGRLRGAEVAPGELAEVLGISVDQLAHVLSGDGSDPAMQILIARFLGFRSEERGALCLAAHRLRRFRSSTVPGGVTPSLTSAEAS